MPDFARIVIAWQRRHGRHALPWQGRPDPYRIWLAEVMLQQTQVAAVIPYYARFVERFPNVGALAGASLEEVLGLWSGLGYYARARNLHAAARVVAGERAGRFPRSVQELQALPGIGRSTAGAIAACAFGERAPILDGNARRLLARCFGVAGDPASSATERRLWALAESLLPRGSPRDRMRTYTQAVMDLGATVCRRSAPGCGHCPLARQCVALREDRIAELPSPRRRRPLPLRRAVWLVLTRGGEVLLERRPPSGIWGGLWAFPELPGGRGSVAAAKAHCRNGLGCEVRAVRGLAPVQHGFTHFRLRARPLRCDVRLVASRAEAPGRLWLPIAEAARAAVPVPVRRLLRQLALAT